MKVRPALTLLFVLVLGVAAGGRAAAAVPPAPTPLAPAFGANVLVPFTISWSAVSDPSGIVAYNWQVSSSSTFTPVILQNSTNGATQDIVSGLANGTYFWRVQAVNGAFVQGAWSPAQSFNVTGAGAGAPGTPTLGPTKGYSTFHPLEVITFNWTAVPGAATYVLQASKDPSFPVLTRIQFDNIPNTTFSFAIGHADEGNYWARVFAVNASGIASAPSNLITFSVFFNNPLPPPPSPVSPVNGTTVTLPVTLTWTEVPNPQPSGYELQIARDSGFSTIEELAPQLNQPSRTVLSLTPGTKFWRVRSHQGDASPTTAAVTAFSTTGTFTVSSAPPTPVSVTLATNPLFSGDSTAVAVQLTAAVPASGATITLTSSNPTAAPAPSTITMPGNTAWTQFFMQAGQVTSPTPATLTATLNSGSASASFNVLPPSLKSLSISPSTISGGAQAGAIVMLNGQAPASGAFVSLSSNSSAVSPPSSAFVAPGSFSVSLPIQTNAVTTNTTVTITASWNGVSTQAQLTLTPQQPPTSLTLNPTSTIGLGGSSFGTVTVASPSSTDNILQLTSSHPAVASVNNSVMIPAGVTTGGFNIFTSPVTVQTVVTISVSGGGVTQSATLTVNPAGTPPPPPALSSFSVSPSSVTGGSPATGTVMLASAAPTGATVVTLSSNLPGSASVPASVTVAAGATSASFTVTTFNVAPTTVQLTATLGGTILFAPITVNSPASSVLNAVTVNPTSVLGGNSSTGTVTLAAVTPSPAVVSLSSSNAAVASVPASVTIAAGATSATFTVSTSPVAAASSATIFASFGGVTLTVPLTVTPPPPPPPAVTLSTLALSPTSVVGPASSTGSVTLSAAAPAGGALVSLSSSNTAAATVPPGVTVLAGSSSATFKVSTLSVVASTPVTISASFAGLTKTALLTVTPLPPAPAPTITRAELNAGQLRLEGSGALPNHMILVDGAALGTSDAAGAFKIQVQPFSSPTCVVTVNGGGSSTQATLSGCTPSAPPALSSVMLTPATVAGGSTLQGTVSMSPAPSAATAVTLSSSNTVVATVPASVTVAAGSTTASFSVTTTSVTASTTITIAASFGGLTKTALLTVSPPAPPPPVTLSALTLSPASVASGSSSAGTVTLAAPAPAGGVTVGLSSSNTLAATIPASVTVLAGSSSATFTASTLPVTASTAVTITGTIATGSTSALLTVTPPAPPPPLTVSGLVLNPTSVVGGNSSVATVTLSAAAPAGGAVVTLSSSNPAAANVPPVGSVTVPAGVTNATFTVTTVSVTASTSATISASFGGATRTALLTVTPAAPPPAADTLAIQLAEYAVADQILVVEVTSTSSSATLKVFVTSTGALVGTLANNGGGKYTGELSWSVNPQNITVKSSLGGSATKPVTAK